MEDGPVGAVRAAPVASGRRVRPYVLVLLRAISAGGVLGGVAGAGYLLVVALATASSGEDGVGDLLWSMVLAFIVGALPGVVIAVPAAVTWMIVVERTHGPRRAGLAAAAAAVLTAGLILVWLDDAEPTVFGLGCTATAAVLAYLTAPWIGYERADETGSQGQKVAVGAPAGPS